MFQELDIASWNRLATYEFFRDYKDPYFNIAADLNVTELHRFCKNNDLSFAFNALFFSVQTANAIREFRLRLKDGKVVEFDTIHATQTILNDD